MDKRIRTTVLESELIKVVTIEGRSEGLELRCLYSDDDLARYIVVSSKDVQSGQYQVPILAKARYSIKKDHLTFQSELLTDEESMILSSEVCAAVR